MKMTGAEIVVACLLEQGVDTVFGYPGGAILNVYDALYKHKNEIRHILSSHEQGASHMADGYARAAATPEASARLLAGGTVRRSITERFSFCINNSNLFNSSSVRVPSATPTKAL